MNHTYRYLKINEILFSKVVHAPLLEPVDDVLATTLARPSVLLTGLLFSTLAAICFYFSSKIIGTSIVGSEFVVFMLLGMLLGLFYEKLSHAYGNIR